MKVTLKYILIIFTFICVALEGICTEPDYKNNLLSVSLKKLSTSDVQVTLFMQKPYADPLSVIKKGDFEYVIILADTYHSISSQPSIAQVAPLITNADVKLFPYLNSANNGYTKITILTSAKLNITTKAIASATNAKNDSMQSQLEELIATKPKHEARKTKPIIQNTLKPIEKTAPALKPQPKPKVIDIQQVLRKQNIDNIETAIKHEQITPKEVPTQVSTAIQPVNESEKNILEAPKTTVVEKPINTANDFDYFIIFLVTVSIIALCALFLIYKLRKQKQQETFSDKHLKETMQSQINNIISKKPHNNPEIEKIKIAHTVEEIDEIDFSVVPSNSAFEDYLNPKIDKQEPDNCDSIELLRTNAPNNEIHYKVIEEKTHEDENKVINTFQIDDRKGFYLSTYEQAIVLLGYIDDSLFVLDKFPYDDGLKINAKMVEKRADSKIYLVKVGRKRAFYEVSDFHIALTLEL